MTKALNFLLLLVIALNSFAKDEQKQIASSSYQFNYKMILKVDMKKREKILKANNEEPTIFDKALTYLNGDINAATVVDTVERKWGNLKITSVMSPTTVLSYAIGDKTYKRESLSELDKNGYRTYSYFEKRGEATRTTALVDYKKMNVDFFVGKKIERTEKINGDVADMLSVVYEALASNKKNKPIQINNSKSNKPIFFDEAEIWDITVSGKKYRAKRYTKRINKVDGATFDIWLDEETKIPLRYLIGLNENYGATMVFELESFKKIN